MLQQSIKKIMMDGMIVAILVLLNAIVLTHGYIDNQQFYWWLTLTIPLLLAAVYKALPKKKADYMAPLMPPYFLRQQAGGDLLSKKQNAIVHQDATNAGNVVYEMNIPANKPALEWKVQPSYPVYTGEEDLRVTIGNHQCRQPYSASILNIGTAGSEALSNAAIQALNEGAMLGGFACNTGEDEISAHHLNGGNLIWQIGPGYFGCRNENGNFNTGKFMENAVKPEVKMIELKLSHGNKYGYVPATTDSSQLAGGSIISPPRHTAFSNVESMMVFLESLREMSFGKPIGLRLCIENKKQFYELCYCIQKTGVIPDFITIDGVQDETGAVLPGIANETGMPLYEALTFVSGTLQTYGLKEHIKIIAAGKIISGFDIVKMLALGADACCSAGASRFIQMLQSVRGNASIGVANEQTHRYKILDVSDKKIWVANLHKNTIKAITELMALCGFKKVKDITVPGFFRLMNIAEIKSVSQIYTPKKLRETRKIAF